MQLGFGFMKLPKKGEETDKSKTRKLITEYMKGGKGYFDLASEYGTEEVFGELVASRYKRERYEVANKTPLKGKVEEEFEKQLKRCKVDYFDYYFVHGLTRWNYSRATFMFLEKKKKEGKIKHIGISFLGNKDFLEVLFKQHEEIDTVQMETNCYIWRGVGEENSQMCVKYGKKVIGYQPFRGGMLLDLPKSLRIKDPEKYAIGFLQDKDIDILVCGMDKIEHIQKNREELGQKLTAAQEHKVYKAVGEAKGHDPTPCVQCVYCESVCPYDVPIKEIMLAKSRPWGKYEIPKAKCRDCKTCAGCCPQHINIQKVVSKG